MFRGRCALAAERGERLIAFAGRAITRANSSLDEVGEVFHAISAARIRAMFCRSHVAEMRRLVFDTAVRRRESASSRTASLTCTSWGKTDKIIEYSRGDYITQGRHRGDKSGCSRFVTGGKPMMALQYGSL